MEYGVRGASWYVCNQDMHRDLEIPIAVEVVKTFAGKQGARSHQHTDSEGLQLIYNQNLFID